MIVADASVLVRALVVEAPGDPVRRRLAAEDDVAVPHLADVEVVSAVRGRVLGGRLAEEAARAALAELARTPLLRYAHGPLVERTWELRNNVTPYDAAYVALAEALGVALVTADANLAAASGLRCPVEVVGRANGR